MGKTEDDWKGLKLGVLKTVQPNIFQSSAVRLVNLNGRSESKFVCHEAVVLSFESNFFAYVKFLATKDE